MGTVRVPLHEARLPVQVPVSTGLLRDILWEGIIFSHGVLVGWRVQGDLQPDLMRLRHTQGCLEMQTCTMHCKGRAMGNSPAPQPPRGHGGGSCGRSLSLCICISNGQLRAEVG